MLVQITSTFTLIVLFAACAVGAEKNHTYECKTTGSQLTSGAYVGVYYVDGVAQVGYCTASTKDGWSTTIAPVVKNTSPAHVMDLPTIQRLTVTQGLAPTNPGNCFAPPCPWETNQWPWVGMLSGRRFGRNPDRANGFKWKCSVAGLGQSRWKLQLAGAGGRGSTSSESLHPAPGKLATMRQGRGQQSDAYRPGAQHSSVAENIQRGNESAVRQSPGGYRAAI